MIGVDMVDVADNACANIYIKKYFGDYIPKWYPYNQYISDGITLEYTFTFLLLKPMDLAVFVTLPNSDPDQDIDRKEYQKDYIVNVYGSDNGGTITLAKTYPIGSVITITLGSDFSLPTNFKEGRNFNGKELDDAFKQVILFIRELALLYGNSLKYPINTRLSDINSTVLPPLKDEHIWEGRNGKIIQIPTPSGGGGGGNCCDILRKELANNNTGTDGAGMIGFRDNTNNISTNLSEQVNKIISEFQNIQTVPKPTKDQYGMMLYNINGKVAWHSPFIGSILFHLDKLEPEEMYGLLYANRQTIYPWEESPEGIPYSRLAKKWWSSRHGYYKFGSGREDYAAIVAYDTHLFVLINDIGVEHNVVYENMNMHEVAKHDPSTLDCESIFERNQLRCYERAESSGDFSDNGTGIKHFSVFYNPGEKGNISYLDFNTASIRYEGGEYFTFLGIRVYYIVAGKGAVPPSTGIRYLVRVDLFENHTLGEVEFLTKHALRGTGLWAIDTNFRENAWFSLRSPGLKVYLNYGNKPTEYEREKITIYVPKDSDNKTRRELIKTGINKYSLTIPDGRDLYLRGGDSFELDQDVYWRDLELSKSFNLQYGGMVMGDNIRKHSHGYQISTGIKGTEVIRYDNGSQSLYDLETKTTMVGGFENRVAALVGYYYVFY